MGAEIIALEDPTENTEISDLQQRSILRKLKSQLQTIEAKSTVDRYKHKNTLEQLKTKLKKAKKINELQVAADIKNEIEAVEVHYDLANMRAEESYKLIKKVNEIAKVKEDERLMKINNLISKSAKTLNTDVKLIQTAVANYTFDIDNINPDQITHGEDCNIVFSGKDESLNKDRIEHSPQYLFGYTSDKLKHFLKNENFLECRAYLTKLDGDYYLNLDLDLATKDASRNYGFIDKDDMIKLTFINGDNFVANSIYRAEGKLEPYSGHTIYEAVYKLQDIEMELIEDLELDKLAIIWSSGFEEYPIYEIDILQKQLKCLKKEE